MSQTKIEYVKKELPKKIEMTGWMFLVVGVLLGVLAFYVDATHAKFSYLVGFMFLLSVAVGAMFWIGIEYLSGADWSVPFRRISEFLASLLPLLVLLVIPLFFFMHDIFHWTHADAVATDKVLQGKAPYLNETFFIIRVAVCFGVWLLFYFLFTRNSQKQDSTKDQSYTTKSNRLSAIFIPLFAITVTIASIDWMMSLEPHWFSTIFGVYFFAGAVNAALGVLTFIVIKLKEKGYFLPGIVKDHFYSLGTLLFAFTCFWGYIAFSQYMLIWYADLPEETFWFLHRYDGFWMYVTYGLIIIKFVVPFGVLLSHSSKTDLKKLKFISLWIVAAHVYDLYWQIMPNISKDANAYPLSWIDFVFVIAGIGIIILVFSIKAKKNNLVAIGDPKLEKALRYRI